MTDTWITLICCTAMIIGSVWLGYIFAQRNSQRDWDKQFSEFIQSNNSAWKKVCQQQAEVSDLRKQLAKFHTTRDKNGRFTKRQ